MTLRFCKKCKTLMRPLRQKGENFFECPKCGFSEGVGKNPLVAKEKIKPSKKVGKGVKESGNVFATYEHKCKKCGYDKAQVIDVGIFYSDEDNLIMLECGKCGHSERIGDPS